MPAPIVYLPRKDALLDAWAANFATLTSATPSAYGLTAPQTTTFTTAADDFTAKLAAASNPSTRTISTVADKNTSRAALLVVIRAFMAIVQSFPTITESQLGDLGLTVRKTTPTPIPAPVTAPIVAPVGSNSSNISIRFSDETTPDSRSRPFGVSAMELWASVGTAPPAGPEATSFRALATKNTIGPGSRAFVVNFDSADVGKTAFMYGRWVNRRGDRGPWSSIATATIAA